MLETLLYTFTTTKLYPYFTPVTSLYGIELEFGVERMGLEDEWRGESLDLVNITMVLYG